MTEAVPVPQPVKPSVLIVDDEKQFLDMLTEVFADDFNLVTLTSAEQAEELMGRRRFDVLVCDHLMPGEMGLEFLARSGARWPDTRRILLTGFINPEILSQSLSNADLSACLIKPVRPTELAQAIRAAINS